MGLSVWFGTLAARFMAFLFLLMPGLSATELAPAPAPPPEPAFSQQAPQALKIMTFNVWIGGEGELSPENRLPWVAETIRAELPDSVGLQEMGDFWRRGLPAELREQYAATWSIGRDWGSGEGATILYLKGKYRLIDQGVFWLNEVPFWPDFAWEAGCRRVAAWALLQDKQTGFVYLHVNTHLDHLSPLARANGAALVTGFINKMNLPAVLTGDMNCSPTDTPIEYYEAGGLIDVRTVAETVEGARTFHGNGGADPATGAPIDYVFANGWLQSAASWRVLHGQFDGHYPSDHFAVAAELTLG